MNSRIHDQDDLLGMLPHEIVAEVAALTEQLEAMTERAEQFEAISHDLTERLFQEGTRLAEALAALREIEQIPYTLDGGTEAMLDQVLTVARAVIAGQPARQGGE